ncbi:MAG: hypothetical protein IT201_08170 [Thermoleophilia bacterium]|nr:hypothetical protein [Thermoleophilia bacterium]
MLEELVPRALEVLEGNLGSGDERVRQRAAEHVLDRAWGRPVARVEGRMATVADELDELSAGELEELAARALAFLDGVGGPQEGR